jgi:PAS domain S-box-containing protein
MSGVAEGSKPTVVVVDDSSELRRLVRRQLDSSGLFDVVGEGDDGGEAIGLAYRHEPTVVLLDTSMPRMDGIEALPAILALSPRTQVVMFSGFEPDGLAEHARELGAADFIEKSIQLEDLPRRLLRALDTSAGPSRRPLVAVNPRREPGEGGAAAQEQTVLNEHVERFRALFEQAAIGLGTLTVTGTIVRANRALARLMSCDASDLVGVDYGRLTRGKGEELDRGLHDIESGSDLATFEHQLPATPDSKDPRTVRVTLAPVRDAAQQVLYVFAQIQDISDQRAAEGDLRRSRETFRLLVSAVEEYAIFMLDPEGNVVSWNAGATRLKGYSASEIVGRSFRLFYSPEEREAGHPQRNLEAALRDGTFAEEGWRVRKDGSRFWASVVISPVHDDAGRHIGFAKVTRDHSEQREHEQERTSFIDQQTHLLAVTAHELRTPTAVIDGSAAALTTTYDQMSRQEREELVSGILRSVHRLHRLASDLATASLLRGETLELRPQDFSLGEFLRGVVANWRARGTELEIDLELPAVCPVSADASRLAQAVDNLIDNAIRHGSPPITLTGAIEEDQVRIGVTDGGAGVPHEFVPHLFDRFAYSGRAGGAGLGLYLVRQIARGHGGQAEYHQRGDQPTTFRITIPLTRLNGDPPTTT